MCSIPSRRSIRISSYAVVALLIAAAAAMGFSVPEPVGIEPGKYQVGFMTLERLDGTRTLGTPTDYFGNPRPGDITRPFQVAVWYPAEADSGAMPLVYGEYVFPYPEDNRLFPFLSQLQDREIERLRYLFGGNQGATLDLQSMEVGAVADLPAVPDTFPLVVYAPRRGCGIVENYRMHEYLASHGFVVAAVQSVGGSGLNPMGDSHDVETAVRDMELAASLVSELPFVDGDRLAFFGNGIGGQAALVATMRFSRARAAAVAMDPFEGDRLRTDLVQSIPGYAARLVQHPVLWVAGPDSGSDYSAIIDSLSYADRTVLRCVNERLHLLSHYVLVRLSTLDSAAQADPAPRLAYGSLCRSVRDFLDMALVADLSESSEPILLAEAGEGLEVLSRMAGAKAPPTMTQLVQILTTRGLGTTRELCDEFNLMTPEDPILPPNVLNRLGYQNLQRGDLQTGLELLKWNTEVYPGLANSWDSYADACLAAGDSTTALASLRKCLEVLPTDSLSTGDIRAYLERTTPDRIAELESRLGTGSSE